ncbi:MAG TPA: adenylyl-sulfate kinase [Micromonosporaceae bacterium]|nr:adenylyl-sulfate kinase [Micromonosporaceae bacterium]
MDGWAAPAELLRDAPTWAPNPAELADLELLLTGSYAPLRGFLGAADIASLRHSGRLTDGTPWPVPVTLEIPVAVAAMLDPSDPARRALVLTDPEGAPIAAMDVTEATPVNNDATLDPGAPADQPANESANDSTDDAQPARGTVLVGGPVMAYGDGAHGVFRRLRFTPAEVRDRLGDSRVLGVIVDRPLHRPQLAQIVHAARTIGAKVLLMIPVAGPGPDGLPPESLVRAVLAAAERVPDVHIVAIPLASHQDEVLDALLRGRIAQNYGVTHALSTSRGSVSGGGLRVLVPREFAYDIRDGQWRSADDVPRRSRRVAMSQAEIDDLLDDGSQLPEWHTPPAVARELSRQRPPRRIRGFVLFLTGLSGSGKSTIARGVADALQETGERTVTLLDGDVVRRELSAGLTFSKADRDLNIRRIGWVAAEVARHGGLAICCPIAPYAAARATARAQAAAAGAGFVLVHVATPIEVCEQRDRKGLYARARAGLITGMTGVDDPYEPPTDADIVVDTSMTTIDEAVDTVLNALADEGWIAPPARA